MTPLLSMLAGARAFGLTAFKGLFEPAGAFDALATITVPSGGSASITFSGIPTDYNRLQIWGFGQSSRATYGWDDVLIRFNGDTASNYSRHYLGGDGSSVYSGSANTPATYIYTDSIIGSSTAGVNVLVVLLWTFLSIPQQLK